MGAASLALLLLPLGQLQLPSGEVKNELFVSVEDDLRTLHISTHLNYRPAQARAEVKLLLPAGRYTELIPGARPLLERELYVGGYDFARLRGLTVGVNGRPCEATQARRPSGELELSCTTSIAAGANVRVDASLQLEVPELYGAFGRLDRQLTLASGWYPFLIEDGSGPIRGAHRVTVEAPSDRPTVIGGAYFPPDPDAPGKRRRLSYETAHAAQIPLLILPQDAGVLAVERLGLVLPRVMEARDRGARSEQVSQLVAALEDVARLWESQRLPWPDAPPLVVIAPLRHALVEVAEGVVLVSDRAFRMVPVTRFFRFHRIHIARETFTGLALAVLAESATTALARGTVGLSAEAVGAALRDRYAERRFLGAESAFDVLGFWSFIPSVDALLYAPDLPFISSYFPLIDESDPTWPSALDPGLTRTRGKLLYEKLKDRLGQDEAITLLLGLLAHPDLYRAVHRALGADAPPFLATWLRAHPSVRYKLVRADSSPEPGHPGRHLATLEVWREGAVVSEPLQVRLQDGDGGEHWRVMPPSADARRTLSVSLPAPLALAELDPRGRLQETPSAEDPAPRFDNRSTPAWKWLLNSWNVALSATAGTFDTALDIGLRRVWDVHWSYALRADYDPSAAALSGRASYGFGSATNAASLAHRLGVIAAGEYLRPSFGGATESAFAGSAALFYSYDTRQTVWLPEAGRGVRASLEYNHVFGDLLEEGEGGEAVMLSRDALLASARAFQAWRFGGRHLLSVRASAGSYLVGTPRRQLLFDLGGRFGVRGYAPGARLGRTRGSLSVEWLHTVFPRLEENAGYLAYVTGLDGTLYADAAWMGDDPAEAVRSRPFADVGYGVRLYLDYFGVRPGVMAVDVALPLVDLDGHPHLGGPQVYIDFAHSF